MKKRSLIVACLSLICSGVVLAQPVEVDVFQKTATASTSQIGVRVRATGANVDYIGVTFYILYQSANAAPLSAGLNSVGGVDDSKLVTTFGWGSGSRFTNPAQVVSIDPGLPGGEVYNRRYVYGNSDDAGGANTITLTNAWDTVLYITLNTLQPVYPQGGFAYQQSTTEAAGTALTDPGFSNVPFSVASGDRALGVGALPVTFSGYDVKCNDKGVILTWSTATEQNSDRFEIQRSENGTDWSVIGSVAAAGNSNNSRGYQYLDLKGGAAYYRIRQVDIDGRFLYTDIKRTTCKAGIFDVVLYPVPAKDNLTVVIKSDRSVKTDLRIVDMTGKVVRIIPTQINSGNNTINLNVSQLASGQYILGSSDPSLQLNNKFTILR